jgi:hypothetical protein
MDNFLHISSQRFPAAFRNLLRWVLVDFGNSFMNFTCGTQENQQIGKLSHRRNSKKYFKYHSNYEINKFRKPSVIIKKIKCIFSFLEPSKTVSLTTIYREKKLCKDITECLV